MNHCNLKPIAGRGEAIGERRVRARCGGAGERTFRIGNRIPIITFAVDDATPRGRGRPRHKEVVLIKVDKVGSRESRPDRDRPRSLALCMYLKGIETVCHDYRVSSTDMT